MSGLRQREPRYECRPLLDLCYQIPCQADWPHDCGPAEPAHSNQARHGKGKSIKAHDCFVAALCRSSHRELDQGRMFSREDRFRYWQKAHDRTLLLMWREGLIQVNPDIMDKMPVSGAAIVASEQPTRRIKERKPMTKIFRRIP